MSSFFRCSLFKLRLGSCDCELVAGSSNPTLVRHDMRHLLEQNAVLTLDLGVPIYRSDSPAPPTFEDLLALRTLLNMLEARRLAHVDERADVLKLLAVDLMVALGPALHEDLAARRQVPVHNSF